MGINLPNGAEVGEIVLPDGSNASEVIAPDGSTVWERNAIPDDVVDRPQDNNSTSDDRLYGVRISTNEEWPDRIDATLSDNGSGYTKAYIYRVSDGNLIADADISDLSSGDSFSFSLSESLKTDEEYNVVVDAEGGSYTTGYYDSPSFPYTSDNIDITDGARTSTGTDGNAHNILEIGNLGLE